MKLKSYFNPTTYEAQVRMAADAAPAAPFVLLGDVTHEPNDDNASGMQKKNVSHVIFQHIQEQVYLKHNLQDMQAIKITYGGTAKPVTGFTVDPASFVLVVGKEATMTVKVAPAGALYDGIEIKPDNADLIEVVSNAAGVYKFKGKGMGQTWLRIRILGTGHEQRVPVRLITELDARVPSAS